MNNERKSSKAGDGPLKACARRLLRKKRKTRARRGTIWLRALIASKNALKAPMEEAHKKNRKGELYSRPGAAFPCAPAAARLRNRHRESAACHDQA